MIIDVLEKIGFPLLFTIIGGIVTYIGQVTIFWLKAGKRKRDEIRESLDLIYSLKDRVESLTKEVINLSQNLLEKESEINLLKIEKMALEQKLENGNS